MVNKFFRSGNGPSPYDDGPCRSLNFVDLDKTAVAVSKVRNLKPESNGTTKLQNNL